MPMLLLVLSLAAPLHSTLSHCCSSFFSLPWQHQPPTPPWGSCYELRLDFPHYSKRNDLVGNFGGKFPSVDLTSPVHQTQHVQFLYFSLDRIHTSSVSCQCYWQEPKLKHLKVFLITWTSSHCASTRLWKRLSSHSWTMAVSSSERSPLTHHHPHPCSRSHCLLSELCNWLNLGFNSELILSSTYLLCYLEVSFSFCSRLGLGFETGSHSIAQACFEFAV